MCSILTKYPEIGELITTIINIIKILTVIILVVMGMLDFAKASAKGNADEMAKSRNIFFKRCITGALVFFVISIVQLAVSLVAKATGGQDPDNNNIWACVSSLINHK